MWLSSNMIYDIIDSKDIKNINAKEIALKLTMSSAEIEGIDYMNHHLTTVIAAKITDIFPHPNADRLSLVDLDTGNNKTRVVCGATNHKKGDIVALAVPGTKFSEDFIVKETKIRGEKSYGMLCSENELGLSEDHSGIMILRNNTPIGVPLSEVFPQWVDTRFEIDNKSITHRPDLWSHVGFAREIAAIFGKKLVNTIDDNIPDAFRDSEELIVTIENPEAAPRYCGLVVKNIKIEESPDWLKASVTSMGMRPISNIVDITNYVMAVIGEPMHAFDRSKLRGNEIIVRMAKIGEHLKTLDGEIRELSPEDIVIADHGGLIALAGVMGGEESGIDDGTSEIVLEAANFDPIRIRKTATRHNLRSEAAIRFEKSLDPNLCSMAIKKCYELIKQLNPNAEAATRIVDTFPKKPQKIHIDTSADFIRKRLGDDIDDKRIINILTSLDFKIENIEKGIRIEIPSYRSTGDISIPEDIVEEVGRIHGYDNIRPKAPFVPCITPNRNETRLFERSVKEILVRDHNLIEVSNYSFVNETLLDSLNINEDKEVRLRNPLSMEQDRLRRSLIPNLIKNIELNHRYKEEFRIFELGRVYLKKKRASPELATEITFASGVIYSKKAKFPLFYTIKNIVMDLLEQLNNNTEYMPSTENLPPYAHPSRSMSVMIDNQEAGLIFELHPETKAKFEINGSVGMFNLNITTLFNAQKVEKVFSELQKYPEVPFEISVLADKYCYTGEICSLIKNSNYHYVKSVEVISIYQGAPIPEGMKSVSIKIVFSANNKTLSSEEVDNLQKKVIQDINKKGYKLR